LLTAFAAITACRFVGEREARVAAARTTQVQSLLPARKNQKCALRRMHRQRCSDFEGNARVDKRGAARPMPRHRRAQSDRTESATNSRRNTKLEQIVAGRRAGAGMAAAPRALDANQLALALEEMETEHATKTEPKPRRPS